MDRIRTFIIYILWIVTFYILSNFLINVGLNSMYKEIDVRSQYSTNISIEQAEATNVNGRMRGTVTNEGIYDINGKYIKVDFYSIRNVNMGTKYIEIADVDRYDSKAFEIFFEANNVASYTIEIVDEKVEQESLSISFFGEEIPKARILLSAAVILLPMI